MRLRRFAAALIGVAAPFLAGCIQTSTLVKLNPDGSGTIELTTTVPTILTSLYDPDDPADPDTFTVSEARAAAGEMGRGVTFVSATPLEIPDRKGITAVYAFKDIRTVSLGLLNEPAGLAFMAKSDTLLTFAFTRLPNGHSQLTIDNTIGTEDFLTPEPAAETKPPSPARDDEPTFAMMAALAAGGKIDFAIQVGHLVKTNIAHTDGGRVTLLSLDFDLVLVNPASVDKLENASAEALKDVKGIKLSLDPKLTIEFRK